MLKTLNLTRAAITARYRNGATTQALAVACGCGRATLESRLHAWGVPLRRRGPMRRHTLDETFFDKINTEEKAYWLGFIAADGCVRKSNGAWRLTVDLASRDCQHLRKLSKALASTVCVKPGHHGASCYVSFASRRLCETLRRSLHVPQLPHWLLSHYFRGLFDGDGSLFWCKTNKCWCIEQLGSRDALIQFRRWLRDNGIHVRSNFHYIRGIWRTRFSGVQAVQIMQLLYADANIWLDRKKMKFDACVA